MYRFYNLFFSVIPMFLYDSCKDVTITRYFNRFPKVLLFFLKFININRSRNARSYRQKNTRPSGAYLLKTKKKSFFQPPNRFGHSVFSTCDEKSDFRTLSAFFNLSDCQQVAIFLSQTRQTYTRHLRSPRNKKHSSNSFAETATRKSRK